MRILLTADPMLPVPPAGYGGIERIVDALVRWYGTQGHEVGLMAHAASTSPAQRRFGWPGAASGLGGARNALGLRRAVREFQPEVIHSFSRLAYLLPLLGSAMPKVMSYQRHTGGRQIAIAARLGGAALRFTGCSEFICAMGRRGGGAWARVHNFTDVAKFDFVARVPADAPLVFLSRIEAIKGPDLAIAIARASGRRLILAGNRSETGPGRAFWQREIAPHLGHDGIDYIGEVDDRKKNRLLGNAAALLVPIQWDEPFGIVFAESLAAGTPVITCPRGAAPEVVQPRKTGFLISTIAEGIAAVSRVDTLDRAACRSDAEARFSVSAAAREYLAIYASMLGARK